MAHKFGNTWWGAQWLQALERVDDENRLPRGMTYARAGRVESLEIVGDPAHVEALVSGSAYYPYEVKLTLPPAPRKKCAKMIDAIATDPDLIASMQDGELPPEVAKIAEAEGIELFPSSWRQMKVSCSCPDWSRVCKHIAAVFYVLADRIDIDPFLIFRLHGIDLKAELAGRGIDLKAAVAVKPLPPAAFLSREAEGLKLSARGPSDASRALLAPDPQGAEGEAADEDLALSALRSLPYGGLRDIGDTIASLFPKSVPLCSAEDASALPAKLIRRAAKQVSTTPSYEIRRLTEELEAKGDEDEADEEERASGPAVRFPGWEAMLVEAKAAGVPPEAARPVLRLMKNGLDFECGIEVPPASGRGRKKFLAMGKERFFEALVDIPAEEARRLPPECECWREVALAAAHILRARATVPAVIGDADGEKAPRIWWAPALRDRGVQRVVSGLARGIAPWAASMARLPEGLEEDADASLAVAIMGLSAAISGYVFNTVLDWTALRNPADVYEAAIECVDLSPLDRDPPAEAGAAMARALRAFSIGEGYPWRPVLTVRKGGAENVLLNFGILERGIDPARAEAEELGAPEAEIAAGSRPVLFRQILRDPSRAKDRFAALSILKTLGRECPAVDSIRTGRGAPARLPYAELKDFLFDMVPKLSLMGVTLMLPQSMRKLLRPEAKGFAQAGKGFSKGFLTKDAIGEFSWRASLGGKDLTEEEFKELVAHAGEVIPWGDDFVYIDPEELARIRNLLTDSKKMTPLEKIRAVLSEDVEGAPIEVAPELRDAILGLTEVKAVPPPAGLRATLRPYQERGYSWLMKNARLGLGSLIADDMGLGKTLQVIASILALKESGELSKSKALAVLPTTLIENWRREIAKFAPDLTCGIYHGADRQLPEASALPDVTLTSYGTLRRDFEKLSEIRWRLLVVDEAQAIKNPGSAQSAAVRGLKAAQTIAMTGTPVENRLMEFWSILSAVQPRILGTRTDFERTFAAPIEGDHDEKVAEAFRRLTRPFMLRRLKSDKSIIADLPEKNTIDRFVPMRPAQAALYQKTLADLMKKLEKAEKEAADAGADAQQAKMARRGLVLKLITALKQICNSPSQYEKTEAARPDSGKADALLEILRECRETDRKVLIFTQYREMGERLQDWIEAETGERPDFLHGGVTAKGRTAMVDRFQEDRTAQVMIISLKAGGTGLNLTAASAVVHYDLWWNPAVEAQATDRAYRIGQRRDVAVYRFVTAGTFEEKINEMLASKRNLAEMTVATGESWIGDLPAKELKRIFALK